MVGLLKSGFKQNPPLETSLQTSVSLKSVTAPLKSFIAIYSLKKQLLNVNCMPGVLTGNGNTNLIET